MAHWRLSERPRDGENEWKMWYTEAPSNLKVHTARWLNFFFILNFVSYHRTKASSMNLLNLQLLRSWLSRTGNFSPFPILYAWECGVCAFPVYIAQFGLEETATSQQSTHKSNLIRKSNLGVGNQWWDMVILTRSTIDTYSPIRVVALIENQLYDSSKFNLKSH